MRQFGVALACALVWGLAAPAEEPAKRPHAYRKVRVLCIGIDEYKVLAATRYAENDAKVLAKLMAAKYGYDSEVILGADATRAAILDKLAALGKECGPKDAVIIFFAGHGAVIKPPGEDAGRKGYLLPYDADVDLEDQKDVRRWDDNGIDMQRLVRDVEKFKAQHVVLIADSCCSGFLTHPDRTLEFRVDLPLLLRETSRSVVAASTDKQKARAHKTRPHGVFTAALVDALEAYSEDKEPASVVDVFQKVRERVPASAGRTMVPQMARIGNGNGEFVFLPLSISRRAVEKAMASEDREVPELFTRMAERLVERKNGRTKVEEVIAASEAAGYHYQFSIDPPARERLWRARVERNQENAALNDPLAMAVLHYCYAAGLGVRKDPEAAYRWAQLTFDTGHPAGKHVMARCLSIPIVVEKNDSAADRLFAAAAAQDFALSRVMVASKLRTDGRKERAEEELVQAVKGGSNWARYDLADMQLYRKAVQADAERDPERSEALFREGVREAVELLLPGAEAGHPMCQMEIGSHYAYYPEAKFPDQRNQAVRWLVRAAENGHGPAQRILARNLAINWWMIKGDVPLQLGLEQDPVKAQRWAELAARQGDGEAHLVLANLYEFGSERLEIKADWDKAREHCNEAIKLKCPCALVLQSSWLLKGELLEKDPAKAFRMARQAAASEDSRALLWLGDLYAKRLVPEDLLQAKDKLRNGSYTMRHYALHYYTRAAGKGPRLELAKERLCNCLKELKEHEAAIRKQLLAEDPKTVPKPDDVKPAYWAYFERDFPDSAKLFFKLASPERPKP